METPCENPKFPKARVGPIPAPLGSIWGVRAPGGGAKSKIIRITSEPPRMDFGADQSHLRWDRLGNLLYDRSRDPGYEANGSRPNGFGPKP